MQSPNVNASNPMVLALHPNAGGNSSGSAEINPSGNSTESTNHSNNGQQIVIPNVAVNAAVRRNVQINPMLNQHRINPLVGNLYAQNLLLAQAQQRQLQMQQLVAHAQAQQILRPRPFANARVILTPTPNPQQSAPQQISPVIRGLPNRSNPPPPGNIHRRQ